LPSLKCPDLCDFMAFNRATVLLCALAIAGCSTTPGGSETPVAGFVVGDEADAVRAGAAMLSQGGSAADAATAMYFALSVTYPIAAGLGSGGVCIVREPSSARAEVLSFLPRLPAARGGFAIPGSVAGLVWLQAAYGKLPWQRDIARAEQLASAGFTISSALAARLTAAQNLIRLDAPLASEFLDESGQPKSAGSRVANRELGDTLALVRTNGAAGFYRGGVGEAISSYTAAQSASISTDELAGYQPLRAQANIVSYGDTVAYLPSSQIAPGNFTGALLTNLQSVRAENPQADLAHLIALADARTLDQLHITALPQELGSTGFAAVDGSGQAVACAVTMNGAFGSGHTAAGTGVTLARAPSAEAELAPLFLSPMVATTGARLAFAGAAAGGPNGNVSLVYTLMRLVAQQDVIRSRGSTGTAPYDTTNMIVCQNGRCAAIADPQGSGLGIALGK
jgi:gamma-glutamyltranspeptidase/glutathione hydrolase